MNVLCVINDKAISDNSLRNSSVTKNSETNSGRDSCSK